MVQALIDAQGYEALDDDAYTFESAQATIELGKTALESLGPMAESTDKWVRCHWHLLR